MAHKPIQTHTGRKVGLGLGIIGALGALGAYALYGAKNATSNRRKAKLWMFKAKAEVLARVSKLSDASEESYAQAVKEVLAKYKHAKKVIPDEMAEFESFIGDYVKKLIKTKKR